MPDGRGGWHGARDRAATRKKAIRRSNKDTHVIR